VAVGFALMALWSTLRKEGKTSFPIKKIKKFFKNLLTNPQKCGII